MTVIDTGTAVAGFSLIARCAACLSASMGDLGGLGGRGAQGLRVSQVRVYGALATLTYVARSGRVPSPARRHLQHAFWVRPVFWPVEGGRTGRVVRSIAHAGWCGSGNFERAAVEDLGSGPLWLMVFPRRRSRRGGGARQVADRCGGCGATGELPLSPMFGAHTGPGTIGFAALPPSRAALSPD